MLEPLSVDAFGLSRSVSGEPNGAQLSYKMPKALREFGHYLLSLWREGKALVMGGGLFAAFAIWGLITGKSVPVNVGYAALAVTFIWAGFRAWRKEVHEGVRLQISLKSLSATQSSNAGVNERSLIFVNETPLFFQQLCTGHTSLQVKALLQPYLGKWLRIEGVVVIDISASNYPSPGHNIFGSSTESVMLTMHFGLDWSERVLILRQGSKFDMIGKIANADTLNVDLTDCELLGSPTHF